MQKSMSLKYEPSSEPLHSSAKHFLLSEQHVGRSPSQNALYGEQMQVENGKKDAEKQRKKVNLPPATRSELFTPFQPSTDFP